MTKNKDIQNQVETDENQKRSYGTINHEKLVNLIHYDSISSGLNAFDNISKPKINKTIVDNLEKNVNGLVNNDKDIKTKKSVRKQKIKQIEYEGGVPDILTDMSRLNEYYKRNDDN
jgi:hypothetical protein